MTKTETDDTKIAIMSTTMTRMGQDLAEIKGDLKELKGSYTTKEEVNAQVRVLEGKILAVDTKYELARTLIFSMCGLVLLGVVGAVVALVLK